MSDTWTEIQATKTKTSSMRERLLKRRKEREAIMGISAENKGEDVKVAVPSASVSSSAADTPTSSQDPPAVKLETDIKPEVKPQIISDPETERELLICLSDIALILPIDSITLNASVSKSLSRQVPITTVENLLQKFTLQKLIKVETEEKEGQSYLVVIHTDHTKLSAVAPSVEPDRKRLKLEDAVKDDTEPKTQKKEDKTQKSSVSVESLLLMDSAKERENKKSTDEILALLSQPTAKEQSLIEKFKSQGGPSLKEFCHHGTKIECREANKKKTACDKLHFKKIIHQHTDEQLGDCSFLNTCFHMDTCKYVHYEIDMTTDQMQVKTVANVSSTSVEEIRMIPHQWVNCDLRFFDMRVLGKFAVVMADPPWDIHMELPYGTMSDDEMRRLGVPDVQDSGFLFLWVTGRAMELGRECMKLWGYDRCDELIWVKTNQLQRIIRTGRTGHWFNHGKEHCLIGVKGTPSGCNRGLDADVIVAEVRATSHKPDEIYGIIERLSPGTRKLELFGRPHNVQPNWITLGNQVDGIKLVEPDVVMRFRRRYPNGYKVDTDNPKSDKNKFNAEKRT